MPLNSTRGAGSAKGFGFTARSVAPVDVDYLVIAGGAAGGLNSGGGGGAGGLLTGTASLTVGTTYGVTVGAGGGSFGMFGANDGY